MFEHTGHYPEREYSERRAFLSWPEVAELEPYAEFHSHGMFHEPLPTCDEKELEFELRASRECLRSRVGRSGDAFAVPYGLWTRREVSRAYAAGYRAVRTSGSDSIYFRLSQRVNAANVPGEATSRDLDRIIIWSEIKSLHRAWRERAPRV